MSQTYRPELYRAALIRIKKASAEREQAFDEARRAHRAYTDTLDTGDVVAITAAYATLAKADAAYARARRSANVAHIHHREALRLIGNDLTMLREEVGQ